ncbi:hypothetical protein [Streptomyces radiopugnans]|uniref:Uncharacterized protein n=1 Tax=Streptomyces radiopugnans TaxID=403935 RepID=A0A1H9EQM5_9ACTN|nr:hypothetical protein [Streptomyces radiopugnans]SEQ27991.1 hypothetical protein SAMN05216481_105252 [Streptomyces radiopugnans]
MPGDASRTPGSATKTRQPGPLGRAYRTAKANPGALLVVLAILGCAAWWLWPLAAFVLGR